MQKRSRLFIDRDVQGALVFRVAYYWALCVWALFFLLTAYPLAMQWWRSALTPAQAFEIVHATWLSFCYPMLASALLLPLLMWDIVRLSHRHVGPIYRLRNALRDLGEGHAVAPIQFREHDMWSDLAEHFNRVAARLQENVQQRDEAVELQATSADAPLAMSAASLPPQV